MSANGNGQGQGQGEGRGPPEHVRERLRSATRDEDGTITVGDDSLGELAQNVDWENLSTFDEYVLAVLDEHDLLEE